MLYLDGISISKIKDELINCLQSKRVGKIFQNSTLSLSIHFGRTSLFFSCNPSLPICYINEDKEENFMEENSNFLLLLRKYLLNASLSNIEQLGFDRILKFHFSKLNELGEIKNYFLYFEIMGKHSNIIFTDEENKIISLLKKFSLEENSLRILFPGAEYVQPVVEKKISPLEIESTIFEDYLENSNVFHKVEGLGKRTLEFIHSYDDLKKILNDKIAPKIYFKEDVPVFASVLNIEPKAWDSVKEYKNFSEMVNTYIKMCSLSNSYNLLKTRLISSVQKEVKKTEKIILNIEKDIVLMSDHEKYKNIGDILASVLYSIKRGDNSVKAYDFYENKEIIIPLDPLLNPQGNLNKVYKKASKMKRGLEISRERLISFNQKIIYLESVLSFIEKSSDLKGLKNIEDELIGEKIIKPKEKTPKNKSKNKESENYGTAVIGEKTVYFGRNNKENDFLTFKFARKDDIWFHVKDIPGSHFIVKKEDFSEDDSFVKKVALYAAFYSKASKGDKVTVEYTEKKNLNKPKGAPLGFVTYNTAKTVTVIVPKSL
ncbi:NFACT family protein [Fusobacterium perfoetens]|uniref:Rqc2 family fibronectin-binding protein n=1 Tax=Fusobacterium perfoetens TaxID=852 RepID=UPI001F1B09D4|nr:NFACT family protein [Fusobacterium perfoetens]MCF2625406.1 NFACT family protein [Fusobacterium perfoetens]